MWSCLTSHALDLVVSLQKSLPAHIWSFFEVYNCFGSKDVSFTKNSLFHDITHTRVNIFEDIKKIASKFLPSLKNQFNTFWNHFSKSCTWIMQYLSGDWMLSALNQLIYLTKCTPHDSIIHEEHFPNHHRNQSLPSVADLWL